MATIRKRGSLWQVQIRKRGHKPVSKSFTKKADAALWAKKVESEVERQVYMDISLAQTTTLSEVLERYSKEILPTKKSDETYRVNLLESSLGDYYLIDIKPYLIAQYRGQRLNLVKPATVRKELGLLSRVLNTAVKDWGINLPNKNPVTQISHLSRQRSTIIQGRRNHPTHCTP
jgi:hypothetical protein